LLIIRSPVGSGQINFSEGRIVGARLGAEAGTAALARLLEVVDGSFDFEKTAEEPERTIQASSNTALILDILRAKDEENRGFGALETP
jgi:hypothetical protein